MKKLFGKLYVKIILGVLLVAVLATPLSLYFIDKHQQAKALEVQDLKSSFTKQYNANKIIEMAVQDKTYLISWDDGTNIGISALFGGVWVTIYTQPKVASK